MQQSISTKISPRSHFIWVYELKTMQETKMENIAAVKCLAVQKRPIFIFVTQHKSQLIYFAALAPS